MDSHYYDSAMPLRISKKDRDSQKKVDRKYIFGDLKIAGESIQKSNERKTA